MADQIDEIEMPTWWNNGGMLINRWALDPSHPESPYNYIKRNYDVDPTDYGIPGPQVRICECCGGERIPFGSQSDRL